MSNEHKAIYTDSVDNPDSIREFIYKQQLDRNHSNTLPFTADDNPYARIPPLIDQINKRRIPRDFPTLHCSNEYDPTVQDLLANSFQMSDSIFTYVISGNFVIEYHPKAEPMLRWYLASNKDQINVVIRTKEDLQNFILKFKPI